LRAYYARHLAPVRPPGEVVHVHGLAYTWLVPYHQSLALSGPGHLDEPVQRIPFPEPVHRPCRAAPPPGIRGHRPGATPRSGRL